MATSFQTPNMGLTVPVVGQELSPTWANDLNGSLSTIDSHNHSSGSGVQITPNGLNINASLPFNSNAATGLAFVNISAQGGAVPAPMNYSLYTSGVDLYFQDGGGNPVRITSGGNVNATSSGISSGTASASFVSSVLVATQSAGVGAAVDGATYILRYNGSYPSPSGNYIALQAPSSLSGGYAITFPTAVSANPSAFVVMGTTGQLSYVTADSFTLSVSGTLLGIPNGGVGTAQLANLGVTTAKLNDQAVTNGKLTGKSLSSSPASIGNVLGSSSCGTAQTTSASFTNVTNLSGTITSTGRPVMISLIPDGTLQSSSAFFSQSGVLANAYGMLQLSRNGTPLIQWSAGPAGTVTSPGAFTFLDVVGGGTWTYSIQYAVAGGQTLTIYNCKLYAWEI